MRVHGALETHAYQAIVCIACCLPGPPLEMCLGHHRHPSMPPLWVPEACEPCSWPILRPLRMAMGQASHSPARCNDAGSGPVGHDGALDSEAALQPVTCGNLARQINLHLSVEADAADCLSPLEASHIG